MEQRAYHEFRPALTVQLDRRHDQFRRAAFYRVKLGPPLP